MLPRSLPASLIPFSLNRDSGSGGGVNQFLDTNSMSHEELKTAAAASTVDKQPLRDLLSRPPSMIRTRQAFVTGLEPPPPIRVKAWSGSLLGPASAVAPEEAAVMLAEYLGGARSEAPWHALGVAKPIMIDGAQVHTVVCMPPCLGGSPEKCVWAGHCHCSGGT